MFHLLILELDSGRRRHGRLFPRRAGRQAVEQQGRTRRQRLLERKGTVVREGGGRGGGCDRGRRTRAEGSGSGGAGRVSCSSECLIVRVLRSSPRPCSCVPVRWCRLPTWREDDVAMKIDWVRIYGI